MTKEDANKYANEATKEYYDWLDSFIDLLSEAIFLNFVKDFDYIDKLKENIRKKDALLVIKNMGNIPPNVYKNLESKQAGKLTKYGKIAYRGTYIIEKAIEKLDKDERISELLSIKNSKYPERIKTYLFESRKAYWIGAYDSSIVMAGRATEFMIKNYLDKKGISYEEGWSLAKLIDKLKSAFGATKKTIEEQLLEKIGEINRIYRNITAHDNPKSLCDKDAQLIWSNLLYVVDKLFLNQ